MLRLLRYLAPYRHALLVVMVLQLAQAIANLYLPDLNADIINEGVAKGDTAFILRAGGLMLGVTFLLGFCSVVTVYWASKASMAFGRDIRSAVFRKVESLSQREIDLFGTASLITRNTNDVQQVQMVALMSLNVMIAAPFMMVGGIIMALRQDVPLSSLIAVVIPSMCVLIGFAVRKVMPLFQAQQAKVDRVNQVMREKLAGIRVIRAFVRTAYEERRFDEANADLTETALRINRIFAATLPLLFAIFNFSTVAIMWFGGLRVDHGGMPIGNLTAFLAYIMQILMSVMMATLMLVMVPRAAASAERLRQVLEVEPAIRDPEAPAPETGLKGVVEFQDVEFRYPGAEDPVLAGISFKAAPGETTAIVGSTGSGKSTLVDLIPRFYDVTGGRVLVDGVDVRDMEQRRLWEKVGFVPQKAFLFSGTVASNLRYGKGDATDEELWEALRVAQGRSFVSAMPGGLEAGIAQGGANVSGGQRQRLAIARALVKRPGIYVFDDSFSALDLKTDAALRAALKHETRDATVIVVAQRVSTIMHADRIIVLEDGAVVGGGRHGKLMATCKTYREIVESQLAEEEAA